MNLEDFARIINSHHGQAFFVGGYVRDLYLGQKPKDMDICITGFNAAEFQQLFPSAIPVGGSFPVFLIQIDGQQTEVALARNAQGLFLKQTTIIEDLLCRDLTINSIAINISSQEIVDPYSGLNDISEGKLRATSIHFKDDALRTYRAARFAAQFNFSITPETQKMMQETKSELANVEVERVYLELKKALHAPKPSLFFRTLLATDVLDIHFKEIHQMSTQHHHPTGSCNTCDDLFLQAMCTLDACRQQTDKELILFSALVQHTDPAQLNSFTLLGDRLKLPSKWIKAGYFAAEYSTFLEDFTPENKIKMIASLVELLEKAQRNPLGLEGLLIIWQAKAQCTSTFPKDRNNDMLPFPDIDFFLNCEKTFRQVKGNKNFKGLLAKEDKRQRQIKAIENVINSHLID